MLAMHDLNDQELLNCCTFLAAQEFNQGSNPDLCRELNRPR